MSGLQFPPLPSVPPEWPQLQLWWQQEATALSEKMDNIADQLSDDVLTPDKKSVWIMMYAFITGEQSNLDTQATTLGVTTEKTNYDSAITALTTYLGTVTAPVAWNDVSDKTDIDGVTFRLKFNDVFVKKQALLNKMTDVVNTTATAAATDAAAAAADAASALSAISAFTTDNILDGAEKQQLVPIVQRIINEKSGLDTQATTLSITTEKTDYDSKYTTLINYLNALSPAYTSTAASTTIVRTTFNTNFQNYYNARQTLINKMADVASTFSVIIDPVADVVIYADASGAVKSGQLTRNVSLTASSGAADITTSGTWSRTVTSGITCTIGASTGILAITALTSSEVFIPVSFVYAGVTRSIMVHVIRQDDPPTNSGGSGSTGGTSGNTTTLGNTTGTSYDTTNAVSGTITVTAGSVGQVVCVAPITFGRTASNDGENGAYGKWQWRVPAGVWADIDTEVQDTTTAYKSGASASNRNGSLSVTHTKTGLSNGSSYEFRFLWRRRDVTAINLNLYRVSGTMTATGS